MTDENKNEPEVSPELTPPPLVTLPAVDLTPTPYCFANETGKITQSVHTMPRHQFEIQDFSKQSPIMGNADINLDWVSNGVIQPREAMPTVLNNLKITGVPKGTIPTIDSVAYPSVDDGEIELSFAVSGDHTVLLDCWPYLSQVYKVTT
jgi:hypothetical protein